MRSKQEQQAWDDLAKTMQDGLADGSIRANPMDPKKPGVDFYHPAPKEIAAQGRELATAQK